MRYIDNTYTDPYFNLACEEYFLKQTDGEYFMLWRNEPCIVIGKNQNTLQEINKDYVEKNSIQVVRRLTGGGAVFHDLGNLNFTFIVNDRNSFNDYTRFTSPVISVLRDLGITAEFSGRNDMLINGLKFSGNAQCRHNERIMHHGTLLFSSNISDLSGALNPKPEKLSSRGIKSVQSRVTNISSHLHSDMTVNGFKDMIFSHISSQNKSLSDDNVVSVLTDQEISHIERLKQEKYSTWNWNYGKSPLYSVIRTAATQAGILDIHMDIKKGYVDNIKIYGDFFGGQDINQLEEILTGTRYTREELLIRLKSQDISKFISNITESEFVHIMSGDI